MTPSKWIKGSSGADVEEPGVHHRFSLAIQDRDVISQSPRGVPGEVRRSLALP